MEERKKYKRVRDIFLACECVVLIALIVLLALKKYGEGVAVALVGTAIIAPFYRHYNNLYIKYRDIENDEKARIKVRENSSAKQDKT